MQSESYERTVFPAGLLLEGRACVVVGSGKVAAHKAQLLLDAKARVTVVGPKAAGEITQLAAAGAIRYLQREFEDADVDEAALVFAATNDKAANRHVIDCCHRRKILCCSVDGNWVNGDFVTPAILRKGSLTLSVSTGGRSCRRSRLVKENLARHVDMVETADLLIVGTSHHQLPIQRREPLHLVGRRLDATGEMLTRIWGIHEFMLLNTCNRIEFIGVTSRETGIEDILKRVMAFFHLKEDEYYVKRGAEAFAHMAYVAAGLLSQSPGEGNIVGQIKEAAEYAASKDWAGGMIQEWISAAMHVSKAIRQTTSPLLGHLEIEDLCADFATAQGGDMKGKRVLVIGTGIVGAGVLSRFLDLGCECEWAYHINKPELPAEWKDRVRLSNFNDFPTLLPKVDLVLCAAASQGHVLHRGHAPFFDQEKDILIIDLSMPRNVEPGMDGVTSGIKVVDLDGLKRWHRREILDMVKVFELGKAVVDEHADMYARIIQSFQGGNQGEQSGPHSDPRGH